MTRRDYERVAASLRSYRPALGSEDRNGYMMAIQAVADSCKAENPLFNRAQFYEAAGVEL